MGTHFLLLREEPLSLSLSRPLRWLLPVLATLIACASPPKPPPEKPPPPPPPQRLAPESGFATEFPDAERSAQLASALPAIETLVRERFAKGSAPGLAFALIIDGKAALTLTMGDADVELSKPVDKDTRFRIGSLTKTFTAFAIRKLIQDNALELEEPLENLVPEAERVLYPTADSPKITIAHLLSHQSGLPMNGKYDFSPQAKEPPSETEVVASLDLIVLEAAPGTRTRYSNLGFSLLGVLVGRAAGQSYRNYLNESIFKPLSMTSASWDPEKVPTAFASRSFAKRDGAFQPQPFEKLGASEGDGGIMLSIDDLARWATLFLEAHPPRNAADTGPLPRALLREMMVGRTATSLAVAGGGTQPGPSDVLAYETGFAWHSNNSCRGERVVTHLGGIDKYFALIEILPEHGVAIVSMSNGDFPLNAMQLEVRDKLRASKGLVARRPVPAAALLTAAQRFLDHRNAPSEENYASSFVPYYTASVPFADQKKWVDESLKKVGTCKDPVVTKVKAPRDGSFQVKCEKGWGKFSIQLGAYGDEIAVLSSDFQEGEPPKPIADNVCPP